MSDKFDLLKAHVAAYTRKDGTFVAAHETSRAAAKPKQAASPAADALRHPDHRAVVAAASRGEIDLNHAAEKHALKRDMSSLGSHGAAAKKLLDAMDPRHVAAAARGELDLQHEAEKAALGRPAGGKGQAGAKPSPQAAASEAGWDDLPDEENPRYSLSGIGSKTLGEAARGRLDLNRHAREELAGRGLDSHGKWVGFGAAKKHHGATGKPQSQHVMEHLQTVHTKVLAAAARGELDLNQRAKHELAGRGHDSSGNWVGFDAAKKHHFGGK